MSRFIPLQLFFFFFLTFYTCQEKLNRCTIQVAFEWIGKILHIYLFCNSLTWSLRVSVIQKSLYKEIPSHPLYLKASTSVFSLLRCNRLHALS